MNECIYNILTSFHNNMLQLENPALAGFEFDNYVFDWVFPIQITQELNLI